MTSSPRWTRSASRSSSTTPSSATGSRRSRPRMPPRSRPPTSSCSCARPSAPSPAGQGLVASLAPKPWPDNAGNGGHIHFSLWDGDRNRFYDGGTPDRLSSTARAFIAGVLEHLPGLCGLTAPSFNSYHRIVPQFWAGAFVCWGYDNREAPVRVASTFAGAEEASTNTELKAADASGNPYLALGGLIAAGLDGIERGLEPPAPVDVDPATIPEDERTARGIARLPATQREALDALAADAVLTGALGPGLATPTWPCEGPNGRPTPRETRHSSSRATSRSTERRPARRPPRARDPARAARHAGRVPRAVLGEPRPAPVAARRVVRDVPARHARAGRAPGLRADRGGGVRGARRPPIRPRSCVPRAPSCCCSTTASRRPRTRSPGTRWARSRAARRAPVLRIERLESVDARPHAVATAPRGAATSR